MDGFFEAILINNDNAVDNHGLEEEDRYSDALRGNAVIGDAGCMGRKRREIEIKKR